jgi:hypothetical protein
LVPVRLPVGIAYNPSKLDLFASCAFAWLYALSKGHSGLTLVFVRRTTERLTPDNPPSPVFLNESAGLLDYAAAAACQNTRAVNQMNAPRAGFPNSQPKEFSK